MTVVQSFTRAVSLASVAIGISLTGAAGCVGSDDAPEDPYATAGKGATSAPKGGSNAAGGGAGGNGSVALKAGAKDSHFPLVDGATWTYHHKYPQNPGKMEWDEIATMRAGTYMDKPAFILEDEEDAQGERSSSTMLVDGTKVQRVYKEVKVADQLAFKTTYDPGFLRYDESWSAADESTHQETYDSLQICVMQSSASKCAAGAMLPKTTTHTFKVINANVQIKAAGRMFDTVQIERVNLGDLVNDPSDDETKHFWYAPEVGKVREEDQQDFATEELTSFEIP